LVALAGFEHLPWSVTVGGDPEGRGVGHGIFDKPGSEHLTVESDFHQSVDQEAPIDVLLGCGSVEGHVLWLSRFWAGSRRPVPVVSFLTVILRAALALVLRFSVCG